MAYDVSSWFLEQIQSQNPAPIVRQFLIGTSDYSERVAKWPKFEQRWDDIKPTTLTMKLANEDQALNALRSDKTVLRATTSIKFGFTHQDSGDETVTLHSGRTSSVRYRGGAVDITVTDKFQQLGDRTIGSSDVPVEYIGSNYNPADLTWYFITSHGGYSAVESDSNPDIDYTAWSEWRQIYTGNSVFVNAHIEGKKALEMVRKMGRYTTTAIFTKEGKISFHRFGIGDANVTSLTANEIDDLTLEFSGEDMVNKQSVYADYSVESDYWKINAVDEDTASVNSYGLSESTEKDKNIWYVNSVGALDMAQREVIIRGVPFDKLKVKTFLQGFTRLVGETAHISDGFHSIDGTFRIMGTEIDMETARSTLTVDQSQYFGSFILDTSSLNGADVLT